MKPGQQGFAVQRADGVGFEASTKRMAPRRSSRRISAISRLHKGQALSNHTVTAGAVALGA